MKFAAISVARPEWCGFSVMNVMPESRALWMNMISHESSVFDVSVMCSAKFQVATLAQVAPAEERLRHRFMSRPSAGLLVVTITQCLHSTSIWKHIVLLSCSKVPLLASSDRQKI